MKTVGPTDLGLFGRLRLPWCWSRLLLSLGRVWDAVTYFCDASAIPRDLGDAKSRRCIQRATEAPRRPPAERIGRSRLGARCIGNPPGRATRPGSEPRPSVSWLFLHCDRPEQPILAVKEQEAILEQRRIPARVFSSSSARRRLLPISISRLGGASRYVASRYTRRSTPEPGAHGVLFASCPKR